MSVLLGLALAAASPQQARVEAEARLAEARQPLARIGAALVRAARRPPALAIAATQNADDQRRLHAALAGLAPAIEARTEAARAELRRADLRTERAGLPDGEDATAVEALIARLDRDAAASGRLAGFDAPPPRPGTAARAGAGRAVYRLPVGGRLLVGTGELAASGVRARGLLLATRPGAPVIAPAAGEVAYAGRFRRWPAIVILRHGHGWTSVITGLESAAVKPGGGVAAGARIGRAGSRVGVELRREGQPIDVTGLIEAG